MRTSNERGIALITTLLVMSLTSALLVGFTAVVMSNQRLRFVDRDRTQAFYGASAGLEKLTADLGNLFFVNVAPTSGQINALTTTPPSISGVSFTKLDGTSGYQISSQSLGSTTISTGPYQGLYALITKYTINVTARTTTGGEAHLTRETEAVAIPVFQFGMFSDVDLSFFAGPNFNFGGRVHSNGNLFLAEGTGSNVLTLSDKVTAVKEVIRQRLQNGVATTVAHAGTVSMATAPGAFRALARTEGSVVDGVGSALNDPTWTNISLSTYNGYIRNGRTGARTLNLPLITIGGANTDLVRRPAVNEDVDSPTLFGERYFSKVSLRILLSDTTADITNLPTIDPTRQPVLLDGNWNTAPPNNGTAYGPIDATHPPIATSPGPITATTNANTAAGAATINVVTVPAGFRPPAITLNGVTVTCTSRTATTFFGCPAGLVATATGSAVTATVNSVAVSTTTTTVTNANASTVTVVSTAAFAPGLFWLNNTAVTCTGNTTTTFTGCTGTPASTQPATITTNALSSAGTGLIGGYLKVEMQDTTNVWRDVTMEILNWGIASANLGGGICADPNPNAILRLQRLRDNPSGGACNYASSLKSTDYWPNVLFDPREGLQRDVSPGGNLVLGGVMHYITIDIANLSKWFKGTAPYAAGSGVNALSINGYSVYFSDRRNNRNGANQETGEYGWEDFVNPTIANGAPNGTLDAGEDVNASGALDTYGQFPSYNGVANSVPPGATAPLNATARPTTLLTGAQAKVNGAVLFRHGLKLVRGSLGNIVTPGLTIAAENPIYVQGDWNANQAGFGDPHAATSLVGDAVTLLSNNWNDNISFSQPYSPGNRPRGAQTYYRVAIISGKGPAFAQPAGTATDFGTDGGAHNFLRYLEGGGGTLNYRGSIATFYFNRQAVGTYKCCTTVYSPPTRNYVFDVDFLDPAKLPPLTPVFRDLNTIGFSQEIRPGR